MRAAAATSTRAPIRTRASWNGTSGATRLTRERCPRSAPTRSAEQGRSWPESVHAAPAAPPGCRPKIARRSPSIRTRTRSRRATRTARRRSCTRCAPAGGASLPHTHTQLYALDLVPAAVARERERFGAYAARTMGQNLLADLVAEEVRLQERVVAIDAEAVLMAPYASRMPFQLMLAPRRPRARVEDDGPSGASLLRDGLCRLARH